MKVKQISPEQFLTTVWSGGITEEILIYPPEAIYPNRDFIYRISTAIVESQESVFTPLPDFIRYLAPLNGPLSLVVGLEKIELEPFAVLEFDGAEKVASCGRPGLRDLNLMVRKGHRGNLKIIKDGLVLEPTYTQVILCIKLDGSGAFLEITESWLIPKGTKPDSIPWNEAGSNRATVFAVFTLPEACY